jgi:hypothetical protein
LVDWRARDIDRAATEGKALSTEDARWLISELRNARSALTQIIALAHDIDDSDAIAVRIRFAANKALGLYEVAKMSGFPARAIETCDVTVAVAIPWARERRSSRSTRPRSLRASEWRARLLAASSVRRNFDSATPYGATRLALTPSRRSARRWPAGLMAYFRTAR